MSAGGWVLAGVVLLAVVLVVAASAIATREARRADRSMEGDHWR